MIMINYNMKHFSLMLCGNSIANINYHLLLMQCNSYYVNTAIIEENPNINVLTLQNYKSFLDIKCLAEPFSRMLNYLKLLETFQKFRKVC